MSDQPAQTFLLDTNVFIQAYQRHYAMDLCPGFWESLEHYCRKGRLLSIDRVRDEFGEGDDLYDWVKQAPDALFVSTTDTQVGKAFGEMVTWVQSNASFTTAAKRAFASNAADGWLVAYAKVHGFTVVTHEVYGPNVKKSVKIPNVCREFDVRCVEPFSMLRSLGVAFGWK